MANGGSPNGTLLATYEHERAVNSMGFAFLDEPWRTCFDLAWEAFCAGSVPVGAVVIDPDGSIVARGRNRRFEHDAPAGQLANTYIAHAEVNALASLPAADYLDHVLYTSTEPCLLCTAAMGHAHVGRVRFAAVDPSLGAIERVPELVDYMRGRWPIREGPFDAPLSGVAGLLTLVFWVQSHPDANIVRVTREKNPDLVRTAQTIVDSGEASALARLPPADGYAQLLGRMGSA